MAELVKKLNIKKNSETTPCSIYTTTDEAGQNNLKLTVDDISAFVVLGEDLVNASSGRIKKAGVIYNIKTQSKPPYNKVEYRTPGTFTFTVPNNVTTLRISVAGAGGGSINTISMMNWLYNGGNGELVQQIITVSVKTITIKVGAGGQAFRDGQTPPLDDENRVPGGEASQVVSGEVIINALGGQGAGINSNGANAGNGQGGKGGIGANRTDGEAGWVIIEYGGDI